MTTAATASVTPMASPARAPEWPASGHGRHHRDDHRDFRYTTQHFDFSLNAGLITGIHHLLLETARARKSASRFGTGRVSKLVRRAVLSQGTERELSARRRHAAGLSERPGKSARSGLEYSIRPADGSSPAATRVKKEYGDLLLSRDDVNEHRISGVVVGVAVTSELRRSRPD